MFFISQNAASGSSRASIFSNDGEIPRWDSPPPIWRSLPLLGRVASGLGLVTEPSFPKDEIISSDVLNNGIKQLEKYCDTLDDRACKAFITSLIACVACCILVACLEFLVPASSCLIFLSMACGAVSVIGWAIGHMFVDHAAYVKDTVLNDAERKSYERASDRRNGTIEEMGDFVARKDAMIRKTAFKLDQFPFNVIAKCEDYFCKSTHITSLA